ncbi:unnamed protein product [Phytophthora lilii]|uniref:Unnamed protein product n=1 Tax=Phytophthora lilii TaxID=2077276 RepID=A0A9W6X8L6_9STRA|nr:unnamed protein product [Phytophthora lilii]
MAWLNDGGINMLSFSAGVSVPKTTPPSSVGTLLDAARTLCRYSQEYFVDDVRDVFEALLDFMQQLDGWHTWSPPDLPHLVFWVNSVLKEFRHLVHSSNGNLDICSRHAVARLSLNDGDLQNVMHALARRPTSSAVITQRPQSAGAVRERGTQRQQRIPPAIFDLIPKHNGLPICLRFLSSMGCPSGNSTRCAFGARAHVAPDALDARVKGHIIQRMGGLDDRFAHL